MLTHLEYSEIKYYLKPYSFILLFFIFFYFISLSFYFYFDFYYLFLFPYTFTFPLLVILVLIFLQSIFSSSYVLGFVFPFSSFLFLIFGFVQLDNWTD